MSYLRPLNPWLAIESINKMINEHDLRDMAQQCQTFDPVTKPKHYMLLPNVEVRDVLKALTSKLNSFPPMVIADYVQMMQYGMRFMEKNGIEDLKKMRWYLDKVIEQLENKR